MLLRPSLVVACLVFAVYVDATIYHKLYKKADDHEPAYEPTTSYSRSPVTVKCPAHGPQHIKVVAGAARKPRVYIAGTRCANKGLKPGIYVSEDLLRGHHHHHTPHKMSHASYPRHHHHHPYHPVDSSSSYSVESFGSESAEIVHNVVHRRPIKFVKHVKQPMYHTGGDFEGAPEDFDFTNTAKAIEVNINSDFFDDNHVAY